jgi:hypothetical protein
VLAWVRKAGRGFFCFNFPQFVALLETGLFNKWQVLVAASKPAASKPAAVIVKPVERVCWQLGPDNFEGGAACLL